MHSFDEWWKAGVRAQGKCGSMGWKECPLKEKTDFEIRDKVKGKFQPHNVSFRPDPAEI